jgi:uncharacterized protein (DUF4415 family)
MKRARISTSFPAKADIEKAIAAAPESVIDPECPYDPNDPKAVAAFWKKGEMRRPGQRGPQRHPTKVSTTLRLSPEVLAYFKAGGPGWQKRVDEALKEWVAEHSGA